MAITVEDFLRPRSRVAGASYHKVLVSREGVALFNARWPGSRLSSKIGYCFEFDAGGDLVNTSLPVHLDGPEASALAEDCKAWIFDGKSPQWLKGGGAMTHSNSLTMTTARRISDAEREEHRKMGRKAFFYSMQQLRPDDLGNERGNSPADCQPVEPGAIHAPNSARLLA